MNFQTTGVAELENVSKEILVQMLERMWLIRHFEVRVMEVHSAGEFTGAAHPYIGEEAVAVGACARRSRTPTTSPGTIDLMDIHSRRVAA